MSKETDEYFKELDKINEEISKLSKKKNSIIKFKKIDEEEYIKNKYLIKVKCTECRGSDIIITGGADIESDPPEENPCNNCKDRYVWMIPFETKFHTKKEEEMAWEIVDRLRSV